MRGNDIDTYTTTFKHLVKEAGYDITDRTTHNMYARGLPRWLMGAILKRDVPPTLFNEWVNAAKMEFEKNIRYEVMMGHGKQKYEWRTPRQQQQHQYGGYPRHHHRHNGRPHHDTDARPYDPMNVDLPTFTRVNRAYTEQDKSRFKKEGRCFHCDKQGHMARECPAKKHQQSSYRAPPSSYGASTSSFGNRKPFNKPSSNASYRPKPQGYRKFNKPRGFGAARSATIEEMDDDQESINPPSLAARTARLSDDQKEEWLQELNAYGVPF
jgi:hypothetical protein